jgi:hypothetical protein
MGPFPLAVLIACLRVMRGLCLLAGGLLGLLALVQQVRGDEGAQPAVLGLGVVILLVLGLLSGRVAAWLETAE